MLPSGSHLGTSNVLSPVLRGLLATLTTLVGTVVFVLRKRIEQKRTERQVKKYEQPDHFEQNANRAMFVGVLAYQFAQVEGTQLSGYHFKLAVDFYKKNGEKLGIEPDIFPGIYRMAKMYASDYQLASAELEKQT